jgi:class 3 adenylate cyclase/tetratricopeptide (TPR) repeat protein
LPDEPDFCDECGLPLTPRASNSRQASLTRSTAAQVPSANRDATVSPVAAAKPVTGIANSQPASSRTLFPSKAATPASSAPAGELERYVPKELLQKLDAARASGSMVGERRIVTMLFCDVKGSTAAAEQLDPEEWTEIMNGAFEHMIQPVYAYEGTVARLMGDALLAFFGAPLAHEDDPARAVLAGLDIVAGLQPYRERMRSKWGIDFNVRVGINTGLVVVGAVGSDLRMEYSAMGDAINLAARMEQTATPGTVQIAGDTYRLVRPLFEFENLGGIEVKGKSERIPAYRVLGRKAMAGSVRGIEGLHADIVGRADELSTLGGIMTDLRQGVGRIVCLLGEAGLGKTRLTVETSHVFSEMMGAGGDWYEIGCLSYEANQAYGLVQRIVRRILDIAYNDSVDVIREKLASLAESQPDDRQPRARQLLGALFGLEIGADASALEGEAFRRELVEIIRHWWRTRFTLRPTVLVFDDMHWADTASIELLRQLLPLTEEIPLVFLFALRPERNAPAWQLKTTADEEYRHRYSELVLRPLSEAESNELLNRLLHNPELPAQLRSSILAKSAGNPFFIEEVVRTLIDSGALVCQDRAVNGQSQIFWRATNEGADFAIPDNLQSLLSARIDRLEEATRGTLQVASVIGRTFYRRVLQAVDDASSELDRNVSTLLRLDMIREAARVPEVEYAFRNPLTQEAVYKTILLKRRRAFHRRVGEAMETLYPDRLEGLYGLLAYHFGLAGEQAKAISYYRRAAGQAIVLFAYDDALHNLHAALDLVEPNDPGDIHLVLREELGDVCRLLRDGRRAIENYEQALDVWGRLSGAEPVTAVRLHRKIVEVVTDLKWSVGLQYLQQANASRLVAREALYAQLDQLESDVPNAEAVRALVALSTDAWRMQDPPDWDAALRFAQTAVDKAEQLGSAFDLSQALGALATVLDGRSMLSEHRTITQKRLAICREAGFSGSGKIDELREGIEALRSAGAALMYVGEYQEALPFLREAEERAIHAQVVDQQTNSVGLQAQCLYRLDRWDDVLAIEERWRSLERRYPRERVGETCYFVALSGAVYALRGDHERARTYAKESFDYMVSMSGQPDGWQRNQFY